jgi:hypothetical protein
MIENKEIRGGDPRKAVLCRWTLDRLYRHPDLIEQLKRAEYELAWSALRGRTLRGCLLQAFENRPDIQSELALRTGLLRVLPKEEEAKLGS